MRENGGENKWQKVLLLSQIGSDLAEKLLSYFQAKPSQVFHRGSIEKANLSIEIGKPDLIICVSRNWDFAPHRIEKFVTETSESIPKILISNNLQLLTSLEQSLEVYCILSLERFSILDFERAEKQVFLRHRQIQQLITEKKKANQESQFKSVFLSQFSHEIRTPLNAVIGMADLLEDSQLTNYQADLLTGLKMGGARLLSIVSDILDISKIESGNMELNNQLFDIRDLVFECLKVFSGDADKKGILLADVFSPSIPSEINGDSDRIRQVLLNYLSNAIKYTESGYIIVSVDFDQLGRVRFSVRDTGRGISREKISSLFSPFKQAEIEDMKTGTGLGLFVCKKFAKLMQGDVSAESILGVGSTFSFSFKPAGIYTRKLARSNFAFLEFFVGSSDGILFDLLRSQISCRDKRAKVVQLDQERSCTLSHSVGREIVLSHRIDQTDNRFEHVLCLKALWKSSNPIKQSLIKSPIRHRQLLQQIAYILGEKPMFDKTLQQTKDALALKINKKILIVDDDELNLKILGQMLRNLGFEPDQALNGLEAINKVYHSKGGYDIIFMDCQMPVMDGYQASKKIKAYSKAPIIIALTANAYSEDREQCLDAGMDRFLTKPVTKNQIVKVLAQLSGKSHVA